MSNVPPVLQNLPSPLRLQSHLQDLLRITAASWELTPPKAGPFLPRAELAPARAAGAVRLTPPGLRA